MDTRVQTKPEFNLTRYHKNKLIFHCTLYLFINIYLPLPFSHCITNTFYLQKSHINTNLFKLLNIVIIALQFIRFIWSSYHWLVHLIKINIFILSLSFNLELKHKYLKTVSSDIGTKKIYIALAIKHLDCVSREHNYFILKEKNGLFKLFVLG